MALAPPPISIVMLVYNHEKYVAESIDSVLAQTFPDFELIVVNDGSTDRSEEIVRSYKDPRIICLSQENQGPSAATNAGVRAARGAYVALACGDDAWYPHRLQRHYECLVNSGYRFGFCWVDLIDEDGRLIEGDTPLRAYFDQHTKSAAEMLRQHFFEGNRLSGATVVAERELLLEAGLYHPASVQAQDFAIWIRLGSKYAPLIVPERLVKYRVRANDGNLSSGKNAARTWFELYQIYREMFDEVPPELFREAFRDQLRKRDFRPGVEYELEKAFIYLHHRSPLIRTLGNEKLFRLLRDSEALAVARAEYGFGLPELFQLNNQADLGGIRLQELQDENAALQHQLNAYASSHWARLRNALVEEPLSWQKPLKIAYYAALVAAPKSLRPRLEHRAKRVKRALDHVIRAKTVQQEPWPDAPLLSVIIPCFNYGKYIKGALTSLLEQTFQDFEVIVVDGGSTDGTTLEVLRNLEAPKTKVYFREGRHLLGDNRNFGIERARGKYVCCLDPDDKLHPTYLEKALFLLENYRYDIVSTSVQEFEGSDRQWIVPRQPSMKEIVCGNQFSTVAVFAKKMWETAGGFRDWGFGANLIYEDWEMWIRMMALGARAVNILEPLMFYRVHYGSQSRDPSIAPVTEQARKICTYNAQYLTTENFANSVRRNAVFMKVRNANLNLRTAYAKDGHKPRVLLALPYMVTGGGDIMLLHIAECLKANGFDLAAFTTLAPDKSLGDTTARYEALTKEIYHLHRFLPDPDMWKDFVISQVESKRTDILFVAGCAWVYPLLPNLKRRFPRLKIVDQQFNEFGHIENHRKYARFIDATVVTSNVLRDILTSRYGEPASKVHVIVNGVDVDKRFNPELVAAAEVPKSEPMRNRFLVTFAGRFSEEKCPDRFVDIAALLKNEPDLHFVMLGDGPEYAAVRRKINDLGLADRFYVPGFVEVAPVLKASGVLVVCSRIEGIPLTLMESMSLGVPVVASRVGGIPTIIRDGYNGFLCDPGDAQGFANAILKIARDERLRASLGANTREYAVAHLSVANMNRQYLELFRELIGSEGHPSERATVAR